MIYLISMQKNEPDCVPSHSVMVKELSGRACEIPAGILVDVPNTEMSTVIISADFVEYHHRIFGATHNGIINR